MVALPAIPISTLNSILPIILGLLGLAGAFFVAIWYWSLDHQTEVYDNKLRQDIKEDPAFSGIQRAAEIKFIATSNTRFSKFTTLLKKKIGWLAEKPDKIVIVEGDTVEDRHVEMIRERMRYIPGRNILPQELFVAIRNHYAYKLALSEEEVGSATIEYFQSRFEEYRESDKIHELSRPENYANISLLDGLYEEEEKDPLNDVFLPLVEAAEETCVAPVSSVNDKIDQIDRCREHIMLAFFVLWTQRLQGVEVSTALEEDECLSAYRTDIRDEDNWGYWLLPSAECDEAEFSRMQHIAWRINETIEEYWTDGDYSILHPNGESLIDMDPVEKPFLLTLKEESEFRGGGRGGGN